MCSRSQSCVLPGLIVLAVSGVIGVKPAVANDLALPKQWKDLDFKQFCPKIDDQPKMLVLARMLASNYQIPLSMLDWNDTGITYDEYRAALSTNLCQTANSPNQHAKCEDADKNPTKDAIKQSEAPSNINFFLTTALKSGPVFDVVLKTGILRFAYKHSANLYQVRATSRIMSADDRPTLAEALFSTGTDSFALKCVAKPKDTASGGSSQPSDTPASPSGEDATKAQKLVQERFRLRGSPDDLTASRDNADNFKSASSATLAINNDNYSHKNTFDGHFALGYAIESAGTGRTDFLTIPYVKLERSYTTGTGAPKTSTSVQNVGFGVQENILFPLNGIYGTLAIRPDYTYSLRDDAQVGKLQVSYEPYPSWNVFGQPAPIGSTDIVGYVTARAIVNIGRVFNSGSDSTLGSTNTFSQGGAAVNATFSVDDKSDSSFKGFSVPLTYTYLYGFAGQYKSVPLFTVGLNYSLAKYVTMGASHTWGRNLDTFEKQNIYKLTLGVKY